MIIFRMKIMLLEDDYLLNKAIKLYFKSYELDSFLDGSDAYDAINSKYDVYLIDIDVPNINGIDILKEIKSRFPLAHVIMISATIEIDTIEMAYKLGCDDYIKKPFEIKELELKIDLISNKLNKPTKIENNLEFDSKNSIIINDGEKINLTLKETKLLNLLLNKRGEIVSNEYILYEIWDYENSNNQIRQLVGRLNKKLPENIIKNRKGLGYIVE